MIEVSKGLYWVGAIDWEIRDFHGYATPKGTTYNAYLIVDEKIALVDTVKEPFRRGAARPGGGRSWTRRRSTT